MIIKDCPSYPGYQITDDGHVFSHRRRFGKGKGNGGGVVLDSSYSRELNPYEGHGGYIFVAVSTSRGQRSIAVHTLLADAFINPCPPGQEVRHLDGIRKNNNLSNLAYGTPQENAEDTVRYGGLKGMKHPRAIINDDDVRAIREKRKLGEKINTIAQEIGCSHGIVDSVVHNHRWGHVV